MQLNGNFNVFLCDSFLPPKATSLEERKKDFDKIFNHYDVVSMLLNSLGADDFFFCVLILSIYLTLDQFSCMMLCRGKPPDMERILSSSLHSAAEIYMMCGSAQRPSINPMIPPRLSNEA